MNARDRGNLMYRFVQTLFLHKHNNSDNLCLKMKNFYIYVYYLKLIH